MPVIKEKKRSVQIKCQNCDTISWVKKGSLCHRTDLCGKCVQLIDASAWAKMVDASEQTDDLNRRKDKS